MDCEYENLIDDTLINECNEIRAIAKKSWLSSAGVSLAHLDNVKATVYNVGLTDPRDLKATNLRERKTKSINDTPANPPLSNLSLQQTACGSNNSIPDLVRQLSSEKLQTRPASASTRKSKPPSGKKPRPQSAKEPLPTQTHDAVQTFGVKGAKYDPSGRPPKGIPSTTTTGWVGPPAGLKYPNRPPSGQGWKLEFIKQNTNNAEREAPPPPQGTPVPPLESPEALEQEEKTKRVFELFIGDPYKAAENDEEDLFEDSDSDFGPDSPVEQPPSPVLLRKPTPESLKLSLPAADDDEEEEEEEMDTDRLLKEAEMVAKKLDLQEVFKLNKVSPPSGEVKAFHYSPNPALHSNNRTEILTDMKIEEDVSTLIGDENVVLDNANIDNSSKSNTDMYNHADSVNETNYERKGIIHDHRVKSPSEHEKSFVKFSEDKNVTVDITPRNIGRKVTELMPQKMKKTPENCFVDLIEVRNRIEPILQTGRAPLSPSKPSPPKRPPSGKLRSTHSSLLQKGLSNDKSQSSTSSHSRIQTEKKDLRAGSPVECSKYHLSSGNLAKQRSAPLNRAVTPISTVTVDYGEETNEKSEQKMDEKSVSDAKPKKRKKKHNDDIITMMEKIGLSDRDFIDQLRKTPEGENVTSAAENNLITCDNDSAKLDADIPIPTVYKSEPEKNYYEIARHSSMSNKDEIKVEESSQVYKTTKTIEFDELKPKELTVKSVIDPQLSSAKEKEKFLSSMTDITDNKSGRTLLRSSSANVTRKPRIAREIRSPSQERPTSRLGFVAMAPSKSPRQKSEPKKILHRPSSAPSGRLHSNHMKGKELKSRAKTPEKDGQKPLTDKEKEEREKVIDNLLERTKTLLGEKEEGSADIETEKKKARPASAHIASSRSRDQRRVKSAGIRRPTSAVSRTTVHKHTGSCKTPRKSSSKRRTVVTEPCIINTNTSFDEDEAPEDILCQEMEKDLAKKGVNVKAETLQRALYPPTGRTKYYRLTADLPRSNSLTLLSHPKVWLPQEYKRLQKAEKTLSQANEIMYLQHRAELRREKLAQMSPEEQKKEKKKQKKGGKKLRRSQSFG